MIEPRAHRDDPSTSWEAAHSAIELANRHRVLVLHTIARLGVASSEDVAAAVHLTSLQVMKRVTELLQLGSIDVVDEEGETVAGRRCRRYRIHEERPEPWAM